MAYMVNSASTTTGIIWNSWATNSAVTIQCNNVWTGWNLSSASVQPVIPRPATRPAPPQLTEAQKAEQAERAARYEAQLAAERKQGEEADKKAEVILLEHLTKEQTAQFRKEKAFQLVTKSGKEYRIRFGWSGNVEELTKDGKPCNRFCIHPGISIPHADNMLGQKLLLEADEELFRKIANRTAIPV